MKNEEMIAMLELILENQQKSVRYLTELITMLKDN